MTRINPEDHKMDGQISQDIDDDAKAILPTDPVPMVEPLRLEQRNSVFDVPTMEAKLTEYKDNTEAMQDLHRRWRDAYQTWAKRLDTVFGKVDAVDETVAVILGREPGSEYEPFELVSLPSTAVMLGALFGVAQSGYSIYQARKAYVAAKTAETVVRADLRWAKFKGGMATVGLLLSGYVAYRTIADRTSFLIETLPELDAWYKTGQTQITTMKATTEDTFIKGIRDVAVILGVDHPDNNVMYANVIAALNAAMTDAAEIEAQYKVATRMLCAIPGRTPETYTVADTATATGLPLTTVQNRAQEIAADTEGRICSPYLPSLPTT